MYQNTVHFFLDIILQLNKFICVITTEPKLDSPVTLCGATM